MVKIKIIITLILILNIFVLQDSKTSELKNKSRYSSDHIIVKLKSNLSITAASNNEFSSDADKIRSIADNMDLRIYEVKKLFPLDLRYSDKYYKYELDKFYLVYFDVKNDIYDICNKFENSYIVEFSEPDFIGESAGKKETIFPNDEYFYRQWGLYNDGTIPTTRGKSGKPGADMKVTEAWNVFKGSSDVIVAILDSGTKLNHPDLDGRLWKNPKEVKNGIDDDNNGYVDDIYGWNFSYNNSNVVDDGGHGTNIAGTIGAQTNNKTGYAGLDQKCLLMTCKNLDADNLGQYSWWSESVYYAANNGAKILNMSEGGYDYSRTLKKAIDYAYDMGCLIVASMMNKNNGDSYYPASYNNVLAIGATDTDDSRCKQFTWGGGSNWGKHIAVVAPGNKIYGLDYKDNFDYSVYWSGTSQATAYVSAIASLLLGQNPGRTNIDLRKIITSTADDQTGDPREDIAGFDEYHGYGRVNLYKALVYNTDIEIIYQERKKISIRNDAGNKHNSNNVNSNDDDNAKAVDKEKDLNRNNYDINKEDDDDERAKPVYR